MSNIPDKPKQLIKKIAALIPPQYRRPGIYHSWRRFLDDAQFWPHEKIALWQLEQLQQIVQRAIQGTSGYRELYQKVGVRSGEDIRSIAEFKTLPFTSKELFRDRLAEFTIPTKGSRYVTTGGSTGIPFGFHELAGARFIEDAFMQTGWSWTGWKLGQPSAVLRGGFIGNASELWHYDSFHRELALSSYFLTSATLPKYVEAIESRGIKVMQAYPSSLNLLCDLLAEHKMAGRLAIDVIFLGSENVYPWQLDKFQNCFPGTRIFSWYGHCEKAVLAPWCEKTTHFHAWPFYGYTELLDPEGREVSEGGEGELVGTSFHQRVTPFIRYRTMDHAERGPDHCRSCGRQFPILSRIVGRAHEVIVTRTGRYISMTAINMHDDIFDSLRQFQFRQEKAGVVTFTYVPKAGTISREDESRIRTGLEAKLGDDMSLDIEAVGEIPRTKAGKFRFLDQRMTIQYGDKS